MTEDQARAALAAPDGLGRLERWIAEQRPWQAAPGGVRVVASAGGGEPAVWFVPGRQL